MVPGQRLVLAGIMDVLDLHAAKVHYRELRPMQTRHIANLAGLYEALASPGGVTMDCSESVTLVYRLGGISTPWSDGSTGNTETMLDTLTHYTRPGRANIGALVVFDPEVRHGGVLGRHVCMVRRPGPDPVLFSHGQEKDPTYVRLSAERVGGTEPFVLLDVSHL